ncbi:hypothetical protein [Ignavibacterium sp.]|uniref:hypothetical protein n=1 Tax=Ignavibacterium sp. TaxID=2651167 RepID=UPI0021FCB865|nr:hypothetical protein [Ignavibacterium sp.]BDQ03298.1 MAG: hypothetical protein KatS3mg037_1873 [Ignavibacterium sp.]
MKTKLNNTAGLRNFSFRLFLFLTISGFISAFGQSKSNLEIFFAQIDSVGMQVRQNVQDKNLPLKLNFLSSPEYSILENRLTSFFVKNNFKISREESSQLLINFTITEAIVKYNDSFRDGLFGDILVEREINLNGNFLIPDKNYSKDFSYSYTDTIKYDQLNEIENRAYPFTQNNHPSEPFFSSLIEPVIAIGAAATAVILFFTIRSK